MPRVSAVVAMHNAGRHLPATLASLTAQTLGDFGATARLDATGADLCVYDGAPFRDGEDAAAGRYLRRRLLPDRDPFAPADVGDHALFQVVTPAAWLRLYRRTFLVERDLRFPPGHVPDDLCFTAEALAAAGTITVLDEVLVHYRVGHTGTMTSAWDDHPLRFEETLDELRRRLVARDALPLFEPTFRILCLDSICHVLRRLRSPQAFELLYEEVRSRLLAKYGIPSLDPERIPLPSLRSDLRALVEHPARRSPLHPARRDPGGRRTRHAARRLGPRSGRRA